MLAKKQQKKNNGGRMKKFLLILILPTLLLANDYKSSFFAGGKFVFSVIGVSDQSIAGDPAEYLGNGDFHVYGGWEYRPLSWISLSPALGFQRNGWSWNHTGYKGRISYFNTYLQLGLGFHIRNFYISFGGACGMPFLFWGELNGENTTKNMSQGLDYNGSGFFTVGYTIKEHYRVGLLLNSGYFQTMVNGYWLQVSETGIGFFFTYLF